MVQAIRTGTGGPAAVLIGVAVLLGCAGCAGAPAARGTATSTATVTATPSPSTTAADGTRIIGFGYIGDLSIEDTAEEIGTKLGAKAEVERQGDCGIGTYGFDAPDPLTAFFSVVARSNGPDGPVDLLGFGTVLDGEAPPDGLPRTAEGVGIGTSEDDLRAAYGDRLTEEPAWYEATYTVATVRGPDDLGLLFTVVDGEVSAISTGRAALIVNEDTCPET